MKRIETALSGVVILEPKVFRDPRGFFLESWNRERYREMGLEVDFVQDNVSHSARGVLRGLHYQQPHAQGKLVYVLQGEVFDVAVDVRRGSPTFGQWAGARLNDENLHQFWVPPGFAHGFCVLSESALFVYKCTDLYHPEAEQSLRWDDPAISIDWPVQEALLSDKDAAAPTLDQIEVNRLPIYSA